MTAIDLPDTSPPCLLGDALRLFGAALTCLAVPASLLWYPMSEIPGAGWVTLGDMILISLWLTVAISISLRRFSGARYNLALRIVGFSILLAALAGSGALMIRGPSSPAREFCLQMKRFGLAGVLPLAMYMYDSRTTRNALVFALSASIAGMLAFAIFPNLRQTHLAVSDRISQADTASSRMSGLVSNPNDAAFVAVCLAAILGALMFARPGSGARRTVMFGILSASAVACVVFSASRTGLVGLVIAVLFFTVRAKWSLGARLATLVFVGSTIAVGGTFSEDFRSRTQLAYEERQSESNFASRLQAQEVVLITSLQHPLGVGYGNFAEVTREHSAFKVFTEVRGSDSVYCDTLLGAGFLGFLILLALYRDCWRYAVHAATASSYSVAFIQAGLVALAIFGLAAVVPMSVFVAPVAFTLVGSAVATDPTNTREEPES